MKKNLLITAFIFSLFSSVINAQKRIQKPDENKVRPKIELRLKSSASEDSIFIPFKSLKILDYRNDTSISGFDEYYNPVNFKTGYLTFENGFAEAASKYLKTFITYDSTASKHLLMVIRKFWFSEHIENDSIYDKDERLQKPLLPGIKAVFEFYSVQDGFYSPLKRFDTTIIKSKELSVIATDITKQSLTASIKSVVKLVANEKKNPVRKLSFQQVDSFSNTFKNMGILQTPNYIKGVYLSYDEFKKNNPSVKNYELRKTPKAHVLFVKDDNGNEYPIRKIWGFCDGTTVYIKSADMYFKLEKNNNNFYAKAIKALTKRSTINLADLAGAVAIGAIGGQTPFVGSGTKEKVELQLMQLDLETGILY